MDSHAINVHNLFHPELLGHPHLSLPGVPVVVRPGLKILPHMCTLVPTSFCVHKNLCKGLSFLVV